MHCLADFEQHRCHRRLLEFVMILSGPMQKSAVCQRIFKDLRADTFIFQICVRRHCNHGFKIGTRSSSTAYTILLF